MQLTGKERRHLRSIGAKLSPLVTIGQKSLSDSVLAEVNYALDQNELIKLKLVVAEGKARKELASELATTVNAHLVQVLGKSVLLYRENPELEGKKLI
jgi:RNA-binding protein